MINMEYIVAFAMCLVNIVKKYIPANLVPVVSLTVAVALNILNAIIFSGDVLLAGKDAFISAGVFIGIFASGDLIRKAPVTEIKTERDE